MSLSNSLPHCLAPIKRTGFYAVAHGFVFQQIHRHFGCLLLRFFLARAFSLPYLYVFGIDYGLERTGLAATDEEAILVYPLATFRLNDYPNRKAFLAALAERIQAEDTKIVVIGLPLLEDGTESMTTRQVRNFAQRIQRRINCPCVFYNEYLTSENALLRLLLFVSLVCVGISLFGVYSHVTLSCERRRKEIAIRKVNGATSADIIRSFLRQYFYLLLFSCVIALPLGTFVMLHWLEQYVERTPLYWWIYAGIVAVMYVFVVLCIGRSVWRAANENPAEVIKSE